jgi:hypothetical protein
MLAEDLIFWYPVTVHVANMMTASPTIRASWFSFIGDSPQEEYSQRVKNVGAAIRKSPLRLTKFRPAAAHRYAQRAGT